MYLISIIISATTKLFPIFAGVVILQYYICKNEERRKWFWVLPLIGFLAGTGIFILGFSIIYAFPIPLIVLFYLYVNIPTALSLIVFIVQRKKEKSNRLQKVMRIQDL